MKESMLEELINKLEDMIEDATRLPLGYCSLSREKVLDLIDEIKTNIPSEVQMAKEIVEKRDQIILSAERDAEKTISSAERSAENMKARAAEYAKQLVNENQITADAKRQATETMELAQKRAQEIMRVSVEYCDDTMRRVEEAVGQINKEIKLSREQFREASEKNKN